MSIKKFKPFSKKNLKVFFIVADVSFWGRNIFLKYSPTLPDLIRSFCLPCRVKLKSSI